ncbi:uncharacterized protein L3040_005444 [Drepanopeziza brunnea f. sp. 'multigermtubi']|uniref:F-box domain-containing protein n=1 Tax=Marssonina brunnea f. sp. multigermtubi (strain MB_m1) TaxID=1072389 RepID=K1WM20_MARBU|nr:uncharacterized protein MBM_08147 [Drepanopeziza brunnea f. sp. 'multigermtubi' MB_m1]EKD13946.1 hypothetical protein MBM_08147 [Drepanopeziza brunnea f. sp. 'multigermtubi' MB_m1]KAJ5040885.1 hypothetical protein L3040_005444 [Drepanopeziza brunnea f. sp. 'multigermtubi']
MPSFNDLTPEFLQELFFLLPLKDWSALMYTQKYMRDFLKANGRDICNRITQEKYSVQASLLNPDQVPTDEATWMIPQSNLILSAEHEVRTSIREDSQPATLRVQYRLSDPGPAFVYLLDKYAISLRVARYIYTDQQDFENWVKEHVIKHVVYGLIDVRFQPSSLLDRSVEPILPKGALNWYYGKHGALNA